MSVSRLLEIDKTLHAVVATEILKLRRSKVTWLSFLIYGFMIAMLGLFMWIALNPGMAEGLGLLGQKANFAFAGESLDWAGFLGMVFMMASLGGMIFLSFIVTFIFGREYVEVTEKNLLVLPVPRGLFVLAKFVVAALWFGLLSAWLLPLSFVAGKVLGLAGFDAGLFRVVGGKILVSALLCFSTCPLVAWIAVATKGYFAPLGYAIFTLILASLFGHTGWGPWVPWSIIGLYSGTAGSGSELAAGSFLVLAATFLLGLGLTLRHETRADNVQ